MTAELVDEGELRRFERLREFQLQHGMAVSDIAKQAPVEALHSLRDATARAPRGYRDYLNEAVDCYESKCYRASVLMVWAAAIEHIYSVVEARRGGFAALEAVNHQKFSTSPKYRRIRRKNDLLYLGDRDFLMLCEGAGVFNRNARALLEERLDTRNRCGHPTGYVIGRDEAVVYIESVVNNVINGAMIDW